MPKANSWTAPQREETFAPYGAHLVGPEATTPRHQTGPSPDSYSENGWTATRTRVAVQSFAASCEATWPNGSRIALFHGTLRCCWYGAAGTAQYMLSPTCFARAPTIARVGISSSSCACPGKLRLREESIERTENVRTRYSFPQPLAA